MKAILSDFGDVTAFCEGCFAQLPPGAILQDVDEQTCSICMYNAIPRTCSHCHAEGHHYHLNEEMPLFAGQIGLEIRWSEFLGLIDVAVCRNCVLGHWQPIYACGNQVAFVQTSKWEFPSIDPTIEMPMVLTSTETVG